MAEIKFRDLTASDIEVRVQSVKDNGCVLLLYKNARCDMAILDETVGPMCWTRRHYECKGNLFCEVGISTDGGKTFTYKSDCGTESNTEKEKGEASDSFKRACFNWGIGRELYTAPFVWINNDGVRINNKKTYDKFSVEKIIIENKKITAIAIRNESMNKRVFVWQAKQ